MGPKTAYTQLYICMGKRRRPHNNMYVWETAERPRLNVITYIEFK